MQKLLIINIGPVQDFIATARKSRDLWYGSWLLSELAKAAAGQLVHSGHQLIFPSPSANDLNAGSKFNAPNKVVAIVDETPDGAGAAVEQAVRKRLTELKKDAFAAVGSKKQFKRDIADEQVDDLLEFYWVGVAFDGSDKDYVLAREKAERLMSARKVTRNFDGATGKYLPKSSLDGVRESVIDESAYPQPGASDSEKKVKAKAIYDHFGARPAERLSGVDILKRLGLRGQTQASFYSTSHMAAKPFLRLVDRLYAEGKQAKGNSAQLLAEIRELLRDLPEVKDENDGALVFSSRLTEWIPDRSQLRARQGQLDDLIATYAGKTLPSPYFSLLLADGDSMGEAIDNQTSVKTHQELSQTLSQFAHEVENIVNSHEGQLIYSGGDDVLAYLPLHTVLDCANELAELFADKMKNFKTAEGKSPTFSSGIVVAHHLDPLSDTLDLARSAEKVAKAVKGKNALAITVSKRSGADRTIKGKRISLSERLEMMICWRRAQLISVGTSYELQKLYQVLGGNDTLQEAIRKEALRIVERKRESGGMNLDKEKQKKILAEFEKWLVAENVSLLEVAHEMIIANEFAAAMDMAGVAKKECFTNEDLAD